MPFDRSSYQTGVGRVQLRIFAAIAERWELSSAHVRGLLGAGDDATLARWFRGEEDPPSDIQQRLGDLIAIYTALRTLHPRIAVADQWVHHEDADPSLGTRPLTYMLDGGAPAITEVRQRLEMQANGEGWR